MTMTPMPKRQREVLDHLRRLTRENGGAPPTMQQIASLMGVSKVTVYEHIKALEDRGAVRGVKIASCGQTKYFPCGIQYIEREAAVEAVLQMLLNMTGLMDPDAAAELADETIGAIPTAGINATPNLENWNK